MIVKTAKLILELDQKSKYQDAQKLRGFFANTFSDVNLFHNHEETGESIYRYSKIQYRFINNRPTILAFSDGIELIKKYYDKFESIKIGSYNYKIMEKHLVFEEQELSTTDDLIYYKFSSPWFALNQENYEKYKHLTTTREREKLLESILITNILRMSKEMGYQVNEKLEPQIFLKKIDSSVKDIKIIAFTGKFKINLIMPDGIGLGKSVSRGFGTIQKFLTKH